MKVTVLCSQASHPVFCWLEKWCKSLVDHDVQLIENVEQALGGELLFLVSCHDVINSEVRDRYSKALILHASDLPKGRGWSPHIWQVLEGKQDIAVTLLEAEDKVDSGDIWAKEWIHLEGHELYDEINTLIFSAELKLMNFALNNFYSIRPREQDLCDGSHYQKRTPADSELDPRKSIIDQFNQLRVADSERFPAFFYLNGIKYSIKVEKI